MLVFVGVLVCGGVLVLIVLLFIVRILFIFVVCSVFGGLFNCFLCRFVWLRVGFAVCCISYV